MIRNKFGIFILFLSNAIISCKDQSSSSGDLFAKKDTSGINKTIKAATNAVIADTPVHSAFDDPAALSQNKYNRFDTILIRDLSRVWKFDGGIDGSKNVLAKDMEGFWLQFYQDGRFEKGTYGKVTDKGTYKMDNQGTLEMIPSDASKKKSEWNAKFNNDMLILVGTPTYQDNTIQMRLSGVGERPKKQ